MPGSFKPPSAHLYLLLSLVRGTEAWRGGEAQPTVGAAGGLGRVQRKGTAVPDPSHHEHAHSHMHEHKHTHRNANTYA